MIQDAVRDRFDAMRGLGTDDVLAALGLERRRTALEVVLPVAGVFLAGAMIGAGVAFLIAPKSGRETRRELKGKAADLSHRLTATAGELAQGMKERVVGAEEEEKSENGGAAERKAGAHRPAPPHAASQSGPQK